MLPGAGRPAQALLNWVLCVGTPLYLCRVGTDISIAAEGGAEKKPYMCVQCFYAILRDFTYVKNM